MYVTTEKIPQEYYKNFHKWIDEGGARHILYELLNHKIPDSYDPFDIAPSLRSFRNVRVWRTPSLKLLDECMKRKNIHLTRTNIIGSTELFEYLQIEKCKAESYQ